MPLKGRHVSMAVGRFFDHWHHLSRMIRRFRANFLAPAMDRNKWDSATQPVQEHVEPPSNSFSLTTRRQFRLSSIFSSSLPHYRLLPTMVRHDLLVTLALIVFLSASVSAFSVVGPSARTLTPTTANVVASSRIRNTRLYADESDEEEKGGEEEKADEEHVLPAESDTDILNSPAFLSRKIDVLKSDIEKVEEELEEVKELVAEGKAEWGDQLDDLQLEVCTILCVFG